MKRLFALGAALAFAAGCGSSSTSPSSPTKPTFTATLSPANETGAVVGGETSGTGTVTITFDTQPATGTITSASATFVVNLSGFPPGTALTGAHIHKGAPGVSGSIVISANVSGTNVMPNGSGSFTLTNSSPDIATVQDILANPANYYFNVHSTVNPAGFARGQLSRVQ